MHNFYNEQSFEQKLKEVDEFGHKYFKYLGTYLELPQFEEIIMDKMVAEYGEDRALELASYFTSYIGITQQENEDEFSMMEQEDCDMEDRQDDTPPDSELAKQEEKFRNLCNTMCSLSSSLALSLCNIYGSCMPTKNKTSVLALLNEAANAALYTQGATQAMFPNMNCANSLVFAKRALKHLKIAASLLTSLISDDKKQMESFQPARNLFEQTIKTVQDYIKAVHEIPDTLDDMPF